MTWRGKTLCERCQQLWFVFYKQQTVVARSQQLPLNQRPTSSGHRRCSPSSHCCPDRDEDGRGVSWHTKSPKQEASGDGSICDQYGQPLADDVANHEQLLNPHCHLVSISNGCIKCEEILKETFWNLRYEEINWSGATKVGCRAVRRWRYRQAAKPKHN